jgi:hypothetical protein
LEINDYVLLQCVPEKKKQQPVHFVGSVVEMKEREMWRIRCMRRQRLSINDFFFPTVPDENDYPLEDVVRVLSLPKIVRGVYSFADDLSSFSAALR